MWISCGAMTALANYSARIAAGGLLLLAIWEIAVLIEVRQSAPTPEDWKATAAAVRASSETDALIVFAPDWIDPVGRHWLGDRITLDDAARMDAARYRQVWEISIRGASAPDVAGEIPVSEQTFGRVKVRQFIRAAPAIVWDLKDRSRIHEVGFRARKGVLLELRGADEHARLEFPHVGLGAELHVYAGLANYRSRDENHAIASLVVLVDGREVTRGQIDNESGWLRLPVASTRPGPHTVEFLARVDRVKGPIHLAICVAAESRIAP